MRTVPEGRDVHRYLAVLPLFADLSDAERQRLAMGCTLWRYARGDTVFRAQEACDAFFVVIVGQVKLYSLAASGQEKVIEILGPGQSFAEALVFLDLAHIVNAQALADSLLLSVAKPTVFDEVRRDPAFALHMLAGVSRRLHALVHDVESYALQSGTQRLIGYLLRDVALDEAAPSPTTITLPVGKAVIASRLSLTPEYFSRVLRELEDAQLIAVDGRDIRILDVARLAQYGAR